jgi:hypothetical protein
VTDKDEGPLLLRTPAQKTNWGDIGQKLSIQELKTLLSNAKHIVPMRTLWQHYAEGDRYWVIGHTIDKNHNFVRVVYVREEDKGLPDQIPFDCPLMEWEEPLQTETYEGPRFTMVEA